MYPLHVLQVDMDACGELDQIGAAVTTLMPTVCVFIHSARTLTCLEQLQHQQQYLLTDLLGLCSQRRTYVDTLI